MTIDAAPRGCGNRASPSEPLCVDGGEVHHVKAGEAEYASDARAPGRAGNRVYLCLLAAVLVTSVLSVAAGVSCLASLSGLPFGRFPMFYAMGVVPTVVGAFAFVGSVCAVVFLVRGAGPGRCGVRCAGKSRSSWAVSLCLRGVLPFIVFLVLLGLCILGFSFFRLSRQVPPLDKNYVGVPGISDTVHIIRDKNGLVHISAKSRHDAYFGQGFAEAQDRLFQLEFYRLTGRGELASVVGADAIEADKVVRVLNINASAVSLCKNADPKDLQLMEAFVRGINYYLRHESKRPVEFFFMSSKPLFFHEPRPFTVEDLCVIVRLFQFQLSTGQATEVKRFFAFLTKAQRSYLSVESLFNNFTGVNNTILTAEQLNLTKENITANMKRHAESHAIEAKLFEIMAGMLPVKLSVNKALHYRTPQASLEKSLGRLMSERFFVKGEVDLFAKKQLYASNAWMARDSKNRVVGASDPHLGIEFPSVWYFTHLSFPDADGEQYDAAGVSMVGFPGVHIGKTTYVSWGITMSMTDLEDLFVIRHFKDKDGSVKYLYMGKNHFFRPRRERILVRGKKDVVLDLEDTLFGPVVNELVKGVALPRGFKIALYAVPLRHDDTESINVLLSLSDPKIQTAYQLMTNLRKLRSPGLSVPISDRSGNIAYTVTGRHPKRMHGHTGKYPCIMLVALNFAVMSAYGNITDFRRYFSTMYVSKDPKVPDSLISPEENPHFYSPANCTPFHISAANQKIYPDGWAHELGFEYAWAYRGRRLQELLQNLEQNEPDQLSNITRHMEIQLDIRSNIWDQDFRDIVRAFNVTGENAATKRWHKRLMDWDGRASIGSQEAAFFWRWLQSLSMLPVDAPPFLPGDRYVWRMLKRPDALMNKMCVDYAKKMGMGKEGDCGGLGLAMFRRLASTDFQERWGIDLNRLTGIHKMLHKKPIRPVFERTINKDGDFSSLSVSVNTIERDMGSTQASSVRQLYDMQNPDIMYFAMPGGASGNPYSEYYQNLLEKFGRGEYVQVVASAKGLQTMLSEKQARHQQVLSPPKKTTKANTGTR